MEADHPSLLRVPITDAERARSNSSSRSRSQSPSHSPGESSRTLVAPSQPAIHARDRQFHPHIGRFSSLRHAGERYDDPEQNYPPNTGRASLPDIYEESHYSDHDDDEPINQPVRATTFPRTSATAYTPVRSAPEPNVLTGPHPSDAPPVIQKFWQPIWLSKVFLAFMICLLLVIIVAIVAVCHINDSNGGYRISSTADHYIWTWLPTAIFVFVVALWRQVDYHAKALMPWKELTNGPTTPFDSVLVDYISSFQIVSFISAFKRIHNPVIITITTFFIAHCMTIAATGTFIVQERTFHDTFPTNLTTFDSTALDPAILSSTTFPNTSVYTYTQNVENNLGLASGVAPEYAYVVPTLQSQSKAIPANATYNATTDTFVPTISCRLANLTLEGDATIQTTDFPYNSTDTPYGSPANLTLTINEDDSCTKWPQLIFQGLDPLHYIVPEQTLESRSALVQCEDGANTDPILLLSLIEVQYSQDLLTNVTRPEGGDLPIALDTQRSVSRMVNVICQADYTVSQVNVTNNTALDGSAAITLNTIADPSNKTLNGLSPANMTTIYGTMLESNTGLFVAPSDPDFIRTPAFDLLAFTAGTGLYGDFFENDTLVNAAQKTYMGTMPDFASKNLIARNGANTNRSGPIASISWTEDRLYVNWTAVIILLAGIGLMILFTVALLLFRPNNVVPRNPNTIAAAATTMTRSTELNRLLRKLQSPQNKGIAAALNGYEVGTAIAIEENTGRQSFKIHVTEGRPQRDVQEIAPDIKFWNPIWASLPAMIITVCIPLILLALLQVTQDLSDKNQGLLEVPDDKGTLIGSHYIPALVTLLVAALINNLDFYLALFAPWARLYKANAKPEQSILASVTGHFAPNALRTAFKARYWGAFLSGLATIAASFLTIIISGLFVVKHFDIDGPTRSLTQLDTFDLQSTYSVDYDKGAGAMLNLIQHNSSFPAFTWDELVVPKLSIGALASPIPSGSRLVGSTQATVPALRGNLSCEQDSSVTVTTLDSIVQVGASFDVPDSCSKGVDSLDSPTVNFTVDFTPAQGATVFGGKMFDLRFGTNSSQYGHVGEANSSLVGDNPSVGCPSLAFIWGNFQLGNDNASAVNVAICYQTIQSVDVNITLQQNTTDFDPRSPPRYNETLGKNQTNPNGTEIFDFRIQNNLARQLGKYISDDANVDPYFQAMINGSIQMDINRLLSDRKLGVMGINHLYRQYMAQVINSLMRKSNNDTNTALRTRQATLSNPLRTTITRARLVQDNTVKTILHSLLALSALLILAGYLLTKTRNVLPCNPCSIAGTMSLLAGSDLCYAPDDGICECCGKIRRSQRSADGRIQIETIHADENENADDRKAQTIRSGAEWWDDRTFARVFQGKTYSLGWWEANKSQGRNKRYVVDYADGPAGKPSGDWYLGRRRNSETFEIFAEQAEQAQSRGRTRALSDVNERGQYHRADPSPGEDGHELRDLAPTGRAHNQDGRYGDG